ncbi:MAG: inositol monophosphatase family protein [Terriglobia bacterium]
MNNYLQVARAIAQEAGRLVLAEFHRRPVVEYKAEADIVTVADRKSEELIVERLHLLCPTHAIVAEEGGRREGRSEYCWYVDPLDGTTNFAHSYPVFAVSLALARGDEIQVGVVYDPVHEEMFYAAAGEGAWLNQQPIRVSSAPRLGESLVATGFPTRKRQRHPNVAYFHRFTQLTHGVRRDGSAALDLCYVACGRFDGFWELNLNPWDTTAGVLLVREAGGEVTDFQGRAFRLDHEELLATNRHIHAEMRHVLIEVAAEAAPP